MTNQEIMAIRRQAQAESRELARLARIRAAQEAEIARLRAQIAEQRGENYRYLVELQERMTPARREALVLRALRAVMAGDRDWRAGALIYNIYRGLS